MILKRRFSILLLGLALSHSSVAAFATDLNDTVALPDAPTIAPIEEGSGWYLRGDLGTTAKFQTGISSFTTYSAGNGFRNGTVTGATHKDVTPSAGFGVGYKIDDIWRADMTVDFIRGDSTFNGLSQDTCAGAPANTQCALNASSSYLNYMAMVNAYVDLATVSGITPYVGVGLGFTHVKWNDTSVIGSCVDGGGVCGATAAVSSSNSGASRWRKSWALMAGASYDLSHRVKMDVGYRYSRVGSGVRWVASDGSKAHDGGFDRHEVRFGLRISN